MDIKADYNRIYEISDSVLLRYSELNDEFKELLKIADNIKSSWDGPDYENFHNKLIEYVNGLNKITSDIKYIGDNMKIASKAYKSTDTEWENEVKKYDIREVKHG